MTTDQNISQTSRTFQSTSARGLDFDSPPMRLWAKSKRMGTWNPQSIDLSQDRHDWQGLDKGERRVLLHLASLFAAGEESVTLDLLPLMMAIASEGRLEEEMFLTSFLWEEAKHVEAFQRFFHDVADERTDLSSFHTPSYLKIFGEELPQAMNALLTDRSPEAQARASVTYNMIVEGVLAETGYHTYYVMLRDNGIMPGMQTMVGHLKADESRHLAYGVFLLSRLVAEHGEPVWRAIEERMNVLLEPAISIVQEVFACYPVDAMPFGLKVDDYVAFAFGQFQKRMLRIERAREQTLDQIYTLGSETDSEPDRNREKTE